MRPPQPRDDYLVGDAGHLEEFMRDEISRNLRRADITRFGTAHVNPPPNRPKPPPGWLTSPGHTAVLEADARALHAREQATAAALKRLEERAAHVTESRRQAYCAGKVDAESRLFWFGALFGGLIGAAVTFVHLMSGGAV